MKFQTFHKSAARVAGAGVVALGLFALAGCQGALDGISQKSEVPVPEKLVRKMKAKGMARNAPIMMRIFKQDNELEVWKRTHTGRYALLQSYEICKWSGKFGPKLKEGDKQAPEGFYRVNKHQLNPNSKYHLSFNMGFPNAYDRAHGRTGSHLMIHGACSSAGCYSMTDDLVEEIYAMARDSLRGGQKSFQIQAYPFRMTSKNLFEHRNHPSYEFWKMLQRGYDHFEITRIPPKVDVCEKRYVFNTESGLRYPSNGACPVRKMPQSLATAFVKKQNAKLAAFEALLARAENRKPLALEPLNYSTALPGVTVVGSQPVAVPAVGSTDPAVATKPPTSSADLEAVIKPAG